MLRAIHIFLFAVFVTGWPVLFIQGVGETALSTFMVPLQSPLGMPNARASDGDMDHDGIHDDEDDDKDGDGRRNHEDRDRDGDGVDNDEEHERGSDPDDDESVPTADVAPPVISIPASITVEATGITTPVPALGVASAVDDVDGPVPVTNDAPAAFPLGSTTVTYMATDAAGNMATVVQTVTVQDTTTPVITVPVPVDASSPDGNPVPVATGQPTATDLFGPVTFTNDAPAVFPVGSTLVTWTATDANGNTANAFQAVSVTDDRSIPGLPPDPGPAGRATLEGIDSDGDGVRDDVQRWIAISFPDSEKTRAALTQMAGSMQQFLLDATDPEKSYANAVQRGNDGECLAYVQPDNFYDIAMEYRSIFLNTGLRSDAWLQADRHLSGHGFSLLDNPKLGCNFDPDAMPN